MTLLHRCKQQRLSWLKFHPYKAGVFVQNRHISVFLKNNGFSVGKLAVCYKNWYRFGTMFRILVCLLFLCVSVHAADIRKPDSLVTLQNPERGFYRTAFVSFKPTGTKQIDIGSGLVHLRIDLSSFSEQAGGSDAPLSKDALAALRRILDKARQNGASVIIRSSYDPGFTGKKNSEPKMRLVEEHLKQLAAVYSQYDDVIMCIELGTFGPWGEMHSSTCCTQENVNRATDVLLKNTPDSIGINLRTPQYVAGWLALNPMSDLDGSSPAYLKAMKIKGKQSLRIGMYNDGYLGSASDLGTYHKVSRKNGTAWLNFVGMHTFYGGEAVTDASGQVQGEFNKLSYVVQEAPMTHTSYLNSEWNTKLHEAWKAETFHRNGDEYDGENGLKYIQDHLGYRLVLRKAWIDGAPVTGKALKIKLLIENVGFAPVIRPKIASLILKHKNGKIVKLPCPRFDVRTVKSDSVHRAKIAVKLPLGIPRGRWTVYLRLACPGYDTAEKKPAVRFAGKDDEWDEDTRSNKLVSFILH